MDAMHRRTNDVVADGEVVWSRPPDAEAKRASLDKRTRDGGKKARSPRRARRTPLKPLRGEGRMFGQTCGDCRQLFLLLAGHGCGLHPAFPAPS